MVKKSSSSKKTTKKPTKGKSRRKGTQSEGGGGKWVLWTLLLLCAGFVGVWFFYGKEQKKNVPEPQPDTEESITLEVDEHKDEAPAVANSDKEDHSGEKATPVNTYVNSLMEYRVDYPHGFVKVRDADDGKGAVFKKGDISLNVYSEYNVLDWSLKDLLKYEEYEYTYKLVKDNYYITTGYTPDGLLYYQKTVMFANRKAYAVASLTYPPHEDENVKPMIDEIFSFFPNRSDCPPYNPERYIEPKD